MEGCIGIVPGAENFNVADNNKIKGKEVSKGSTIGNLPRKKLVDISNLPMQNQERGLQPVSHNVNDYINKLQQENLSLVKLISERNKILQLRALELQKLRTDCQHFQQRNVQLAQTNSQMLAELNSCKDRLKLVQHELGCKNGLLKALKFNSEVETVGHEENGELSQPENACNKPRCKKRKKDSKYPTDVNQVQADEKINKKRRNSVSCTQEPIDDVFEIDAVDLVTVKPVVAENGNDNNRHCRRRQSARFNKTREEEPSDVIGDPVGLTMVVPIQSEKKSDSKRCSSRRQSAMFRAEEQEPRNDVFEVNDAKGSTMTEPVPVQKKAESKSCSRRQSARFNAGEEEPKTDAFEMCDAAVPAIVESVQIEKKVESKRCCPRRQSSRLKTGEQELKVDLVELNPEPSIVEKEVVSKRRSKRQSDRLKCTEEVQEPAKDSGCRDDYAKCSVSPKSKCGPIASASSVKVESEEVHRGPEAQELRRPSIRPKRQAAEKVQTYKEIPINVKMRRPE